MVSFLTSLSTPPFDPRRQADGVARAFRVQYMETAIAWLELGPSETLLIEVVEDFDVQDDGGNFALTQVTMSATGRRLTLASGKSRDALENYWRASGGGSDPKVTFILHTNMQAGHEQGVSFPDNVTGIDYWRSVQNGEDISPLFDALPSVLRNGDLRDWLRTNPSAEEVKSKLIDRIKWRLGQKVGPERSALFATLVESRLAATGLPPGFAANASKIIIDRVFEIAGEPEAKLRQVRAKDLNILLGQIARPGQPGRELHWSLASWTSPVELFPLPNPHASRSNLLDSIQIYDQTGKTIWFHGASGSGKSTLALLLARRSSGKWLLIDFRSIEDPREIVDRLERGYTDVTLSDGICGIILDDLNTDIVMQHSWRFAMFAHWLSNKGARLVITTAYPPSPTLSSQLLSQPDTVIDAPYLELSDVEEMIDGAGGLEENKDAWAFCIHASASSGHPQLVAAKVISLANRKWPNDALTEDILGGPSEAVSLTRTEARRRLMRDATAPGRALLKRLACIFSRFDRTMAIAAANVDPEIEDPSISLDFLIGPWIERVPGSKEFFRLSPLLAQMNDDLSPQLKAAIQASAVLEIVQKKPIPLEALDVAFWNALFSEQHWFFVKFFPVLTDSTNDNAAAYAAQLSSVAFLSTSRPIFPHEPATSLLVRLIQAEVAARNSDTRLFQSIAEAAVREIPTEGPKEAVDGMRLLTLSKILFAQGAKLKWATRLKWLTEFRSISQMEPLLIEQSTSTTMLDVKSEFGDEADITGFLLIIGAQTIETPEDLEEFFVALGDLEPDVRDSWLAQFKAFSKGYDLYVQSAWANAWSKNALNVDTALSAYERMSMAAQIWGDYLLSQQCIIAQSVLWDEFKSDRQKALTVLEGALACSPESHALLRQKAKVLSHDGKYELARPILEALRPKLHERSVVDQLYTLKEEAVASARLGDLATARVLFLDAANVAKEAPEDLGSLYYHRIALQAEAALCAWRSGKLEIALRELADVVTAAAGVATSTNDAARMLEIKIRWLVGWIWKATDVPRATPPELVAGAISALDVESSKIEDTSQKGSWEDVKLLLSLSGLRCGIVDLVPEIDWQCTSSGFQLFLKGAEYDLATEKSEPSQIALAVLNVAAAFKLAASQRQDPTSASIQLPIRNFDGLTLADFSKAEILANVEQLIATAAFQVFEKGDDIAVFIKDLVATCRRHLGANEDLFVSLIGATHATDEAGTGHPSKVIRHLILHTTDRPHPRDLLNFHLDLIACAGMGGAGVRTAHSVLEKISDDWKFVVEKQSFLLKQPVTLIPRLKKAIANVQAHRPGALTELLHLAGEAVEARLSTDWNTIVQQIGGAMEARIEDG